MSQMYLPSVNATLPSAPAHSVECLYKMCERERLLLRDLRTGITEWLGTYSNLTIPSLSGAGTTAIGIVSRGCARFNHPDNARFYYLRGKTDIPEKV